MNKDTLIQNNIRLSIQLSSDGFSFCTYNTLTHTYEQFENVAFSTKATTPTLLLKEVKTVFESYEVLHNTFDQVVLIHHNDLNTLVPQVYFDETVLYQYLENTVKTFTNDFVSFDEISALEANNVYIPFVNINNFIFESFGEFTYLHSSTVFIENILKENEVLEKQMFVNVYKNDFHVIVLENNALVLQNHFTFVTKEDFVYYILFVAEQLKMDTNAFLLTLYGDISETTEKYELLYTYVRNVVVYNKLNTNLSTAIHQPTQANYNLLHYYL